VKKKLYFLNPKEGPSSLKTWDLDFNIGTTADIEGTEKEFVFGGKYGYGIMNRETGESRWIRKFWNEEERKPDGGGKPRKGETREIRMRSNDGAVDAAGRFFVGAMNDPVVTETFTDEGSLTIPFPLPALRTSSFAFGHTTVRFHSSMAYSHISLAQVFSSGSTPTAPCTA